MSGQHTRRFPIILITAFVLAQYWSTSCAEELGRLFTTPEERNFLEKLRNSQSGGTRSLSTAISQGMMERKRENPDIAVKGFVYRKNARSTVWINNGPMRATDASDAVDVLLDIPDGTVAIEVFQEKISQPHTTE